MSSRITHHASRITHHASRITQSTIHSAVFSGLLLFSLAVHAQTQETPNDEGPYLEGVFAREVGPPLILPATVPEYEPAPLFDAEGNSNSVIVLLDLENAAFDPVLSGKAQPGDQLAAEQAMLDGINTKSQATETLFSRPERARFLIASDRLDPKFRALLKADDPTELLHRYLVLRYASVDQAKAAVEYLGKQPGVVWVGIDRKLEFQWAPNDPYFPINSVSASLYQWGMHAMNFPSAWDRTKGHGYVAAADGGLPNDQAPADLVANYRAQFSGRSNTTSPDSERHAPMCSGSSVRPPITESA